MNIEANVEAKRARTNKNYKIKVKIDPMPNSCYECPFFHNVDGEIGWYEHWNCFLHPNEDSWGVALERHRDCPLEEK